MIFLIYGGNGWIGGQFINILKENGYEFVLGKARVDDKEMLEKEMLMVKPTHVVSFIGRTSGVHENVEYKTIDYLELPGKIKENVRDNLFSPLILAILCKKYDIHLTYLGTGCIFEYDDEHMFGKEENGFKEEDKPNFFGSSYSVVKGYTDELMHMFEDTVLNVRIRMPITADANPKNFITKITTYKKICSIPNSMTVLPELLPIALDLLIKKKTGTINLVNPGLVSHNEILSMYKEIVDNNFTWENFSLEEQAKILKGGRSNNYLDTGRLEELYPGVKKIKVSIRDILGTIAGKKNHHTI